MSSAFAFLDDIVALAKAAAISLDDVASQSAKATAKAAGIVIDDTATTPQYVTGLHPSRELPIIGRIARGSLINKVLLTLGILGLSFALSFTGWPILNILTPLLMAGGAFLAYEGYEKAHEMIAHRGEVVTDIPALMTPDQAAAAEKERIVGAVRTDMILSAEIMTLTFSVVAEAGFWAQAGTLAFTGLAMTVGVYGIVAALVKADDVGLALARARYGAAVLAPFGRGIVKSMPFIFKTLEVAGALAMLWVGGGIIIHGVEYFGFAAPQHGIDHAAHMVGDFAGGIGAWLTGAVISGAFGAVVGALVVKAKPVILRAWPGKTPKG